MSTATRIHHADVIGSMLHPPELLEARRKMRAGELAYADYRRVEDAAVDRSIEIQEQAGFDVVSDGEHRRDIYFGWLVSGMKSGMEMLPDRPKVQFRNDAGEVVFEVQPPFAVTGELEAGDCPGLAEFAYARSRTDRRIKVSIPSPTIMLAAFWDPVASRDAYPDPFELGAQTRDIIAGWMRQLADAGCDYMQVDCPELIQAWGDPDFGAYLHGIDQAEFREKGTELVASLGDVDLPGVTKAMHVCRGNGTQSFLARGGYDEFSEHVFRAAPGFDTFLLEYDDERSGSFEPLKNLPDDKAAILGLVSTKWTRLEDPDELKARIDEAARFHPKEMLGLCTQCGFASASETAEERKITERTQVDKLNLIASVARDVWG